ncbi:MAG: rod shape-determining protein MreD [Phycisphaerae bacterium]
MRWALFAVVLYVVVVVQTALVPFIEVQSVRPDLLVLLAVYLALAAPTAEALLAGWIIGFAVDLNSLSFAPASNVGAFALVYGMTVLVIVQLRRFTFRDHGVTYFMSVFAAALAIHAAVNAHTLYVTGQSDRWIDALAISTGTAFYTALISPYAHWVCRRHRAMLGLAPARTSHAR